MKLVNAVILLFLFQIVLFSQEKQIPFFPEGRVYTIEKNYAKKNDIFTEYESFIEARLFQISGDKYAAEVYYKLNDSIYKDRKLMTLADKEMFISQLKKEVLNITSSEDSSNSEELNVLNQQGRSTFLITSTAVGLGFYGYALPNSLNIQGEKSFLALYMLTAGASFYAPYHFTRNREITLSQAGMTFYGQTRGILHGLALGELLSKKPNFEYYNQNTYSEMDRQRDKRIQIMNGMGLLGSLGEGYAGFQLCRKWGYNSGDASIFQMWGDVGVLGGLLMTNAFNLDDITEDPNDMYLGATIVSGFAGYGIGKVFGDTRNYTLGDAIFYRSTIALGTLWPVVIADYFAPQNSNPYTASAILGGIGGSFIGSYLLKDKDFETGQGLIIALGEIAGGLTGLGIGYLISPDDLNSSILLTSAALGATAGYILSYRKYKNKAVVFNDKFDLNLSLNPIGFINMNKVSFQPENIMLNEMVHLSLRF